MATRSRIAIVALLAAVASGRVPAQGPPLATLTIEYTNGVLYWDDIGDATRFATMPGPVSLNPASRNMSGAVGFGDIVSVNGVATKGNFVARGRVIQLTATPNPSQAIGDFTRGATYDIYLEIRRADGTPIGTIMMSGFTGGPAPPGSPPGNFSNFAVTGGTGAFMGARGTTITPDLSFRVASIQEDPANRRTNGGNRGHFVISLIPFSWPQVVTTATGPAIVHSSDGSLVTGAKPATSGEVLTLYTTGLGPTVPPLAPGSVFPASPLQTVNSPIDITVGGKVADVLYSGGYPGSTDGFQINFRVPSGVAPGMAPLRLTAAFVPAAPVNVPIQ